VTDQRYRLYGLTIDTTRRLPGLEPIEDEAAADVVVELAGADAQASVPVSPAAWVMDSPPVPVWSARTEAGTFTRLRYAGRGYEVEFVLDPAGRRVWVTWNDRVSIDDVTAVLLGPILSCVLHRRARTCLHASVVAVDGRAIACVGAKGAGKSTTALAMIRQGATLVSDDVAVLAERDGTFAVHHGLARLRMRPDPAAALCGSFESLTPMWSQQEDRPHKRYLDLASSGEARPAPGDEPIPLHAVYLLGARGDDAGELPAIRPLPSHRALATLMAHRHMASIAGREGLGRDFARLGRLVAGVRLGEVYRAEGLDNIARVAELILADARAAR
jgi:hypothetical protein